MVHRWALSSLVQGPVTARISDRLELVTFAEKSPAPRQFLGSYVLLRSANYGGQNDSGLSLIVNFDE